jgi:hypothetical protein
MKILETEIRDNDIIIDLSDDDRDNEQISDESEYSLLEYILFYIGITKFMKLLSE